MANSNMPDSVTKLTFDPKQELTVDTRTFGLDGTDEMAITSISTRESFLTAFDWQVADTSETLLWNAQVNPCIWNQNTIGGKTEYHMPACCFVALPFRHWRGTMKYRFQIVASAFHKGRLKVTYDPSYPLTNEYNTNYTRVIDLAQERDFTVEIGWGQEYGYLQHYGMINGSGNKWSSSPIGFDQGILSNGIVSVYVVNELTVPNSIEDNDIQVNVFVSTGDDFEVANPTDEYVKELSWFVPQSGEYIPDDSLFSAQSGEYSPQAGDLGDSPDGDNTLLESAPMNQVTEESMAAPLDSTDHTSCVYFGDPIVSLRQILKRYAYSRSHVPDADSTGMRMFRWLISNFPLYRGYAPGAVDTDISGNDYNYVKNTMINYYTPAFVCWRGGLRWKYLMTSDDSTAVDLFMAFREPSPALGYSQGTIVLDDNTLTTKSERVFNWQRAINTNGFPGMHVTTADQNPVLELELPYYNNRRFAYAKQANVADLNPGSDTLMHWVNARFDNTAPSYTTVHGFVSTAEDFTLGFYTGPPVAYYQVRPNPTTT
jgi:hypothetical protein